MSVIRNAVSVLCAFFVVLAFSSSVVASQQFDKSSFDLYEDDSGDIYFIPKDRFVLIASEPVVPLNLTYPNGFKLVYSNGDYQSIEPLPVGFEPTGSLKYSSNGAQTYNVELADFNGDGLVDWFIQKAGVGSDVLVVFNNAANSPSSLWAYDTIEGINVTKGLVDILVADYNLDGIADLKLNGNVFAYASVSTGFNAETEYSSVAPPIGSIRQLFDKDTFDIYEDSSGHIYFIPKNKMVLIASDPIIPLDFSYPNGFKLVYSNGDYQSIEELPQGFQSTGTLKYSSKSASDYDVHLADFNGDGLVDWLIQKTGVGSDVLIVLNNVASTASTLWAYASIEGKNVTKGITSLDVADYNGDGVADLKLNNTFAFTDQSFGLNGMPESTPLESDSPLVSQDFDYESFDIYEDTSGNIYFIPKERFVLIASDPIIPLNLTYPNGFKLVYSNGDYHSIAQLPSGFQPTGSLKFSSGGASDYNVKLADFNGDGLDDWFVQKSGVGSDVLIAFNKETGTPTNLWAYDTIEGINTSKDVTSITVADYNNDGIVDLKLNGSTFAYTDKYSGFNREETPSPSSQESAHQFDEALFDIYEDSTGNIYFIPRNRMIIIASDPIVPLNLGYPNGFKLVYLNGDYQSIEPLPAGYIPTGTLKYSPDGTSIYNIQLADFNGDGLLDWFIQKTGLGSDVLIVFNNTQNLPSTLWAYETVEGVSVTKDVATIIIADYDGDGIVDLKINNSTYAYSNPVSGFNRLSLPPENRHQVAVKPSYGTIVPGTTSGSFRVDENGSATYSIPLNVPKGPGGVFPSLAFNYSSLGGDGPLGIGWSLSGLSAISRCRPTVTQDGYMGAVQLYRDDGMWPSYDVSADSRFCLDGKRLVLTSGSYSSAEAEYKTEKATFSRIKAYTSNSNTGPDHFTVEKRDGSVWTYGKTGYSKNYITSPHRVNYTWRLSSVADNVGNSIDFNYSADGNYIETISYSNSRPVVVQFNYENRPDSRTGYSYGQLFTYNKRIASVSITNDGQAYRSYYLSYASSNSSKLAQLGWLQECGANASCFEPIKFDWLADHYNDSFKQTLTGPSQNANAAVKQGDFDGDGIADLVWSDPSNSKLLHFLLSGNRSSASSNSYLNKSLTIADSDWFVADLNQDGITDILSYNNAKNGCQWMLYSPQKSGSFSSSNVAPSGCSYTLNMQLADINGDGLADVFYKDKVEKGQGSKKTIEFVDRVALHKKNFSSSSVFSSPTELVTSGATFNNQGARFVADGSTAKFVDVNSDGLSDLIVQGGYYSKTDDKSATKRWLMYEANASIGLNFSLAKQTFLDYLPENGNFTMFDMNSDGQTDILTKTQVHLNTGTGFTTRNIQTIADLRGSQRLDYNHDNLTDLLVWSGSQWQLYLNNGVDFVVYQVNTASRSLPSKTSSRNVIVSDLTGDGRDDFVVITSKGAVAGSIEVHHSGIDHFAGLNAIEPIGRINKITNAGVETDITYGVMGGFESDVYERDWTASSWTQNTSAAYFDLIGSVFLVKDVSSSAPTFQDVNAKNRIRYFYQGAKIQAGGRGNLGFRYLTSYEPASGVLTTTENYQKFPATGLPIKTTKLKYIAGGSNVNRDVLLAKSFGNSSSTAANQISSVTSKYNNYNLISTVRALGDASCDVNAAGYRVVGCSINELAVADVHNKSGNAGYQGNVTYPFIHRTFDYQYSMDGQRLSLTHVVNEYTGSVNDFHGDVGYQFTGIQQLFGSPQAVSKKTITHQYENVIDSSKWYLGRLSDTKVAHQSWQIGQTVPAAQTKHSTFTYNINGMLKTTQTEPDTASLSVLTTYDYDGFGNRTTETQQSHPSIASTDEKYFYRQSKVDFKENTDGRLGDKSYVWTGSSYQQQSNAADYNQFDLPQNTYDANNHLMRNYYDGVGRLYRSEDHLGGVSETVRGFCPGGDGDCPSLAKTYVHSISNTGAESKVFIDVLGQTLRESKVMFDGRWAHVDTEYNARGNVVAVSTPHYGSYGSAIYKARSVYDEFGRLKSVTQPTQTGDATTTHNNSGYSVSITNAKGQVKTEVTNALGQLVSSTNNLGHIIHYKYDALGNLTTVTDPVGNVSSLAYNRLGHKISMNDPDKGQWHYRYNALGELIWQKNANGQVTAIRNDFAGRMKQRIDYNGDPELNSSVSVLGNASWVYDTAAYGIGMLDYVTDSTTGYKKSYQYQSNGLVKSQITRIDNKDYLQWYQYDNLGRTTHAYDPSEAVLNVAKTAGVRSVYNRYGYVSEIREAKNDALYLQTVETDVFGNVNRANLGNGVELQNFYYPQTGQLQRKKASKGSSTLQNSGFTYDKLGNLISKDLIHHGVKEGYTYDGLNRLATAYTTGFYSDNSDLYADHNLTMVYKNDGTGNILRRNGNATGSDYVYGQNGAGPHALTQIGNKTFYYDANGNRITDKLNGAVDRTTQYSVFDKPTQIVKGINRVNISYGPARDRFKRVDEGIKGTTTTRYIGGTEHIVKDNVHIYKRHIAGQVIVTQGGDNPGKQYLVRDNLGSVVATLNEQGGVQQYHSFDPYGKRRAVARDENSAFFTLAFSIEDYFNPSRLNPTRGFTGHEHLDSVGVIHMNGRVYDPETMVFMTADPFVQAPNSVLSLNRYSYVFNNPLTNSDPSGYFSLSKAASFVWKIARFAAGIDGAEWAADNPRAAAAIAITLYTGHYIAGAEGVAVQVAAGAVGGAAAGAIQTGDLNGALTGAAFGAVSGAIGHYYGGGEIGSSQWAKQVSLHAAASGVRSVVSGGKFGHGFLSSIVTSSTLDGLGAEAGTGRFLAAVVMQGTMSEAFGGKFVNGALSAAFTEAFNHLATKEDYGRKIRSSRDAEVAERRRLIQKGHRVIPGRVSASYDGDLYIRGREYDVVSVDQNGHYHLGEVKYRDSGRSWFDKLPVGRFIKMSMVAVTGRQAHFDLSVNEVSELVLVGSGFAGGSISLKPNQYTVHWAVINQNGKGSIYGVSDVNEMADLVDDLLDD